MQEHLILMKWKEMIALNETQIKNRKINSYLKIHIIIIKVSATNRPIYYSASDPVIDSDLRIIYTLRLCFLNSKQP